ncbi:MAG: hypothetical protein AB7L18_03485 [Hyphomicrobiaceae bacterium]
MGKFALFGFGGFMLVGMAAMPFVPQMTPEQDLASGQRFFSSQCETLTRNRKINGKFGRGHSYCQCVTENLEQVATTGDEYRFAEALQEAAGSERWFLEEVRMTKAIGSAREKFTPILGDERIFSLSQDFFYVSTSCARVM